MKYYELVQKHEGYLFTSQLSYQETFDLMVKTFENFGYLKTADKEKGVIIGRYKYGNFGGVLNTFKWICYITKATLPAVTIILTDGSFKKVKDKRWQQILAKIKEFAGEGAIRLPLNNQPPKLIKTVRLLSGYDFMMYNTGKISIKDTRTSVSLLNGEMSGIDYEHFVAEQLSRQGFFNVEVTQASGDFGADIIMSDKNGDKVCVQCKQYSKPVGIKAVQEIIGAKAYYKCQRAMVITTATFTPAAKELAGTSGVELYENFVPRKVEDDELDWIDKIEIWNAMFED